MSLPRHHTAKTRLSRHAFFKFPQFIFALSAIVAVTVLGIYMMHPSSAINSVGQSGADINGDGKVSVQDLSILLSSFGQTGDQIKGDLNNNGKIDIVDLSILLTQYGQADPVPPAQNSTVFSPGSFWYQQIPANVALHPNSAGLVANILNQTHTYYGTATRSNVNINTTAYAAPVYTAKATDPKVSFGFYDCQGKGYFDSGLKAQFTDVPMPAEAQPADGTDAEMVIYSPSDDKMWEFWKARNVNGQWQACWGGRMDSLASSNGIYTHPYGTTATGLPFMGGQITPEELKAGKIEHAIGLSLVEVRAGAQSWPATRNDGWVSDVNTPYEGQRFRLDPSINVDSLTISPVAKMVARAAQTYGFIIWDKAGSVSLRANNPKAMTVYGQADPYPVLFSPYQNYNVLDGIPWERLQALPMDYGKTP